MVGITNSKKSLKMKAIKKHQLAEPTLTINIQFLYIVVTLNTI